MARALDQMIVGLPLRDAPEMRTHGRDGVKALGNSNDVDLLILDKRNRIYRIIVWRADSETGGWLKQNVGREIPVCHHRRTHSGNAQRRQRDLVEKVPASDL